MKFLRLASIVIVLIAIAQCRASQLRTAPQIDGRYIVEETAGKGWYAVTLNFTNCEVRGDDKDAAKQIEKNTWALLDLHLKEEISREDYNSYIKELQPALVDIDKACLKPATRRASKTEPAFTPEQKAAALTEALKKALNISADLRKRAK